MDVEKPVCGAPMEGLADIHLGTGIVPDPADRDGCPRGTHYSCLSRPEKIEALLRNGPMVPS